MKRKDLIKRLEAGGWKFDRAGGNHDIYYKEGSLRPIPVKRHQEIPDQDAKEILKQAGLKED